MFAAQTANEIAASHLAACLKSSKNADEFKPRKVQGFLLGDSSRDHPIALEEDSCKDFKRFFVFAVR